MYSWAITKHFSLFEGRMEGNRAQAKDAIFLLLRPGESELSCLACIYGIYSYAMPPHAGLPLRLPDAMRHVAVLLRLIFIPNMLRGA